MPAMTIADARNKEIALKRIKRLAVSGLPLHPFVDAVFALLHDAIPSSPLKAFFVGNNVGSFICNSPELYAALPHAKKNFFNANVDPAGAGLRFSNSFAPLNSTWGSRTVWRHEDICLPSFHRSEQFNAVTRPLGWWKHLAIVLKDGGRVCGIYPIWREANQREFSNEDFKFAQACAPHIACGLKTAQLVRDRVPEPIGVNDFLGSALWGSGIALMDLASKVVAMDSCAESIIGQFAILEGVSDGAIADDIKTNLGQVHRSTLKAFRDSTPAGMIPVVHLFSPWSGAVLKFRGTMAIGADGREYVTVLIEFGEPRKCAVNGRGSAGV